MQSVNYEKVISTRPKALNIKVLVFDIATDTQIREHELNYNNGEKRRWLAQLIVWACNNGKSVEILNVGDDRG